MTTKPNQEQDKTLDEILFIVADEAADLAGCNYYDHEEISKSFPRVKAAIQAKLAAARDEVIGVNEPLSTSDLVADIRDNLRAEQRTRWDKFVEEFLG